MAALRHNFNSNEALSEQLAQRVADNLCEAIEQRGAATLAVSGGSTPAAFFDALSGQDIAWAQVRVTQVDERWVPETHPDSNARLIRERLLQGPAARAQFVSMKTNADSPFSAEQAVSDKLDAFAESLDVVVLGMGEDGHTASFFPGADSLDRALDESGESFCVAVRPPAAPHDRMTLSLPALLSARHRYLHITGQAKLTVLERACAVSDVQAMPICSVLNRPAHPIDIYYASRS